MRVKCAQQQRRYEEKELRDVWCVGVLLIQDSLPIKILKLGRLDYRFSHYARRGYISSAFSIVRP
jgi:hypothetical protein